MSNNTTGYIPLLDEHELKIFKCKDVKTPSKSWDAAGWDFFIPENLSIFDFAKSYKTYLDESIVYDKSLVYGIPLIFYLKSRRTFGEYKCKLILSWNEVTKSYKFQISEYKSGSTIWEVIDFTNLDDEIIKWITEDQTVISKIEMEPHSKILIPSGIHVNLPDNVFLKAENKSGIASKRGLVVGACVTGDTLIETNKGKFKVTDLTKEFCENNNILIKSFNEITKKYEYKKCDGFRCSGNVDCVKVTFDDGSEIEGSYDHCIYLNDKWDSLNNL